MMSCPPILLVVTLAWGNADAEPAGPAIEFFEREVRPVLADRCYGCHGPEQQKAGLRVDHISTLLRGGDRGPVVVPGDPERSRLIHAIGYADVELQMPPRGRLPQAEIDRLTEWVRRGASWPAEPPPAASTAAQDAFDLAARRRSHWAWQPIARVTPPADPFCTSDHPIDRLVRQQLVAHGLAPAPRADAASLLRRLCFAITGLPPTPEQRAAAAGAGDEGWSAQVDELLASPDYAERWARHWLDLVRYAETYGHEFDYPIENAWRYRDYVIRALDADVPYDQLVLEHVAGDLLAEPRRNPRDGTNESVIATGHYFFHQATHGPVDVRQDQMDRVDNQIDVLGKAFLGLTISCARCHDHKFDAISSADYYAFAGFLTSSRAQTALLDPDHAIADQTAELERRHPAFSAAVLHQLDGLADPATPNLQRYLETAAGLAPPADAAREIEAHDLRVEAVTGGTFRNQDMRGYGGVWKNDRHMWWTGAAVGDRVQLGFDVAADGSYELALAMTRAPDYGIVQVSLDGQLLGGPLDLYDRGVVATGPMPLGEQRLSAGAHRLTFEMLGSNPSAAPARMMGLDTIALRDTAAVQRHAREVAAAARRRRLDPTRLGRWIELLHADVAQRPDHPLFALAAVARHAGNDLAARIDAVVTDLRGRIDAQPGPTGQPFANFDRDYAGWFASGAAFRSHPTRAGECAVNGDRVVLLQAGVAHSAVLSSRHQGALRSPTFTIDHDFIDYRLAGRGGQIRVIVDGFELDVYNALLFEGMSFSVDTADDWRWHRQRVAKYRGHRAHIEILDSGDGYVAVDEIRFADDGSAAPADVAAYQRALSVLTDPPPRSLAVIADTLRRRCEAARTALAAGQQTADLPLLACLLDHGLCGEVDAPRDLARSWRQRAEALPAPVPVLAIQDGTGADEAVLLRGQHRSPGAPAPRRFLEAIDGPAARDLPDCGRLFLARRMLSPRNPLLARVAVNRVWHHLFGRGLVATTDNFGALGDAPSHPELLDWLAEWFRTEGHWSLKRLIRLIVTSQTWQQSSALLDPTAEERDPDDIWLHRMRPHRLEGEALRDAMLLVSGRLDRTRFGPPVAVHLTPFMGGRGRPGHSGPLDGDGRRTIYLEVRRNFLSPMMLAFDTPIPHSTVGRRSVSNVPAQGLILMNDPLIVELARRFAERALAAGDCSERERIARMFEAALGRAPCAAELDEMLGFVHTPADDPSAAADALAAYADLAHALFNLKEFTYVP